MISRNHLQKICAGLHVLPLHQNHIILTFLLYLFGTVSQNYLRYCLLGYSPHFLLNKTLFTTFWLCFFQVYTVLSISSSGPRITPFPISTKINIIIAFGPQCPSSKICVLCIGTSSAHQDTGWRGGGGERKMVERDRGGGYFTCSSWISQLSVPLGYHHCQLRGSYSGASLIAQLVKNLPAMQETWVWSLGWEDPLEKEKTTQSHILAWRNPWPV